MAVDKQLVTGKKPVADNQIAAGKKPVADKHLLDDKKLVASKQLVTLVGQHNLGSFVIAVELPSELPVVLVLNRNIEHLEFHWY